MKTAVGTPDEPSKADLLLAFEHLHERVREAFTDFRRVLDAVPDPPSPGRAAEPLPPGLESMAPMRGFLADEPD